MPIIVLLKSPCARGICAPLSTRHQRTRSAGPRCRRAQIVYAYVSAQATRVLSSIRSSILRSHGQQRSHEKRGLVSTGSDSMSKRMCAPWVRVGAHFYKRNCSRVVGCCDYLHASYGSMLQSSGRVTYFTYVIHWMVSFPDIS
jgi:hypothetical protein